MSGILLRLLFPSWAFFDRVVSIPALEVRTFGASGVASAWHPALAAPTRGARHALVHPDGTRHLALQGLVDRLATEVEQDDTDPVSVALVAALARHAIGTTTDATWQWRIVTAAPGSPARARVLHCSDVLAAHEVGDAAT